MRGAPLHPDGGVCAMPHGQTGHVHQECASAAHNIKAAPPRGTKPVKELFAPTVGGDASAPLKLEKILKLPPPPV